MFLRKTIMIAMILVLSFVFLGLGCKNKTSTYAPNQKTKVSLLTEKPANFDNDIEQVKKIANEKSYLWNSGAKLVYVSLEIPSNFDPALVQNTFVYDADTDINNHWAITIEEGSKTFIRSLIPKEDYLKNELQQILPIYWKVNFVSALQTCEQAGGKKFRDNQSQNYKIELNLFRTDTNFLKWLCKYSSTDPTNNARQEINVDARTGQVIK